ncbi:hypothetical protein WDU94_007140 [Cyamophila willieti]
MNWSQWYLTCVLAICFFFRPTVAVYNQGLFCERLRQAVVQYVGDDFDVYNKLMFEHSVFLYKKLCLHQNKPQKSIRKTPRPKPI